MNLLIHSVGALHCYACEARGNNEVDANIKCLENSNLEKCEDFYEYYNSIDDEEIFDYEYDSESSLDPTDSNRVKRQVNNRNDVTNLDYNHTGT